MHNEVSTSNMNAAALSYTRRGWAVIPVHHIVNGSCTCGGRPVPCGDSGGKHPVQRKWTSGPAYTEAQINQMWIEEYGGDPRTNIGIRTGSVSGIFVFDVDPKNGGEAALAKMIEKHGPLPATWTQRTGSGGIHMAFTMPNFGLNNSKRELEREFGPGIDIRGEGGQIVAAPSVSIIGNYEIIDDRDPVPAPGWLLELLQVSVDTTPIGEVTVVEDLPVHDELSEYDQQRVQRYAEAAVRAEVARYANAAPGTGDDTLFAVCCNVLELIQSPWNLVTAKDVYGALNQARAQRQATHPRGGGQSPEELLQKWRSAQSRVIGRGRPVPVDPTTAGVAFDVPFSVGGVTVAPPAIIEGETVEPDADDAELDGFAFSLPGITATAAPSATPAPNTTMMPLSDDARALMSLLLDRDAIDLIPPVKPLITDVLDMESESWIIGAPGGFKSFVALDWAAHVGAGIPWQGKKVAQGQVIYLAAEGKKGIPNRVRAWEKQNGRRMENVAVLPLPVQVAEARQWNAMVEMCRYIKPVLIVLDTQARITVGMNENDAKEMGVLVEAVRRLKEASGACVLVVHHTGRNGQDARGSSALDGAQDTEIRVDRPVGNDRTKLTATISMDKNKDGDESAEFEIVMAIQEVGVTEDGRVLTSLAVTPRNPFDQPLVIEREWEGEGLSDAQMKIVTVLSDHSGKDGHTTAEIRRMIKERFGEMSRSTFNTALERLKEREVVVEGKNASHWALLSKTD